MKKDELELLENTKKLVSLEKKFTIQILKNLNLIERKKLFVELGFSSLHSYCVEVLGYASSEAYLKISAMRLMREFESVEKNIESGKLSLTTVGELQMNIVKKEKEAGKKISHEVKADILKKIEGKSTRAAQKIVKAVLVIEDKIKPADFKFKEETIKKLKQLGDKLEVQDLDLLVQMLVKEKEERLIEDMQSNKVIPALKDDSVKNKITKNVPLKMRRELFIRANYQCENSINGIRCSSQKYLNVDHVKPLALGGIHSLSNTRILCGPCNQRARVKIFGDKSYGMRAG